MDRLMVHNLNGGIINNHSGLQSLRVAVAVQELKGLPHSLEAPKIYGLKSPQVSHKLVQHPAGLPYS